MIRIENLAKTYGKVAALKGIDLMVEKGELFAYLGPNGAGKTTTIRILTGITRMTSGKATLNGHDIERHTLAAKRQFGLAPQNTNLDSELTVYENLDIHGRLFGMGRQERQARINELLRYVETQDRRNSPVKDLSGGMKRRVMVARALVHNPLILFLDEPTVGLDPNIRRRIWALIKKIQKDGTTVFLTTHYIEEAEFLADRVAFLDEGRIIALNTPQGLMDRLGAWALDEIRDGDISTRFFKSRKEAQAGAGVKGNGFSVRRINLEDAFISLTGRRVKS